MIVRPTLLMRLTPQCGQTLAWLLTSLPHSRQLMRAISGSPVSSK